MQEKDIEGDLTIKNSDLLPVLKDQRASFHSNSAINFPNNYNGTQSAFIYTYIYFEHSILTCSLKKCFWNA